MGDQLLFLNSVEKIPFFNDRLTMSQIIVCLFFLNRHKYRPVSGDAYRSEPLSTKKQCHIMHILCPGWFMQVIVDLCSYHVCYVYYVLLCFFVFYSP